MIVENELLGIGAVKDADDGDNNFAHLYPTVPIFTWMENSIRKNLSEIGDSTWMTDVTTGRSMTYSELLEIVDRTALAFRKRGIGRANEPVLIVADNDIRLAIFIFALWKVGGYFGTISFTHSDEMLRSKIVQTGAKFILTDESTAEEACRALVDSKNVIVIGQIKTKGCIPIDELLKDEHLEKTTMVASANISGRKTFLTNRLIHASGLLFMIGEMLDYQHIFILTNPTYQAILKGIDSIKPPWVSLYPHFLAEICNCSESELSQYDLSSVETIRITACSVSQRTELEVFDKIPNLIHLENIYGMSETFLMTTSELRATKENRKDRGLIGTTGKPFPFVKIKIVDRDDNGIKLGPGQVGEVVVKTPFLMKQYVNLPLEMAKSMRDGWFFTGDLGSYDSEGNLFITGRIKELIKYRNEHVQPTDIEKVLMTHPSVAEAAVVGIPNEIDGQHPLAFVVLRENAVITPEELIQFTQKSLCEIEQLRGGIRFIGRIPCNPTGKILRQDLLKMI